MELWFFTFWDHTGCNRHFALEGRKKIDEIINEIWQACIYNIIIAGFAYKHKSLIERTGDTLI